MQSFLKFLQDKIKSEKDTTGILQCYLLKYFEKKYKETGIQAEIYPKLLEAMEILGRNQLIKYGNIEKTWLSTDPNNNMKKYIWVPDI